MFNLMAMWRDPNMGFVTKERGIRTLMTDHGILVFRGPKLFKVICDRFFKQIQGFFYLGQRTDAVFRFNDIDKFLAVGDFILHYIARILQRGTWLEGLINLIDSLPQFSGTILQEFSRSLLVVASFRMRRIDYNGFALDNALVDCDSYRFVDQHVEQV